MQPLSIIKGSTPPNYPPSWENWMYELKTRYIKPKVKPLTEIRKERKIIPYKKPFKKRINEEDGN